MIQLRTLTDGGQPATEIALLLASFLERAERSLDIALYDLRLGPETNRLVAGTLAAAAGRGVDVRLLYNVDERPSATGAAIPPPATQPNEIEALPFPTVGVEGWPDLMHHKYVVRDGASVWTGSTNWTDDSWSREENVIVVVDSEAVAARYAEDFAQLWTLRKVRRSGRVKTDAIRVGDDDRADVVLAETRRAAGPSHRARDRERRAEGANRVAGADVRPDPRHGRRGGRGQESRPCRNRGHHTGA